MPPTAASARSSYAERRYPQQALETDSLDPGVAEDEDGDDEGSTIAKIFIKLSNGDYTNDDLRTVFNEHCFEEAHFLQITGFRAILEAQHAVDGASEPLPAGFVSSLFDAWCKDGGLNEARFIYGYAAYLKQRQAWLKQWFAANKLNRSHEDEEVLEDLFSEACGTDQMSALEFLAFCEAWATKINESPPPPGFCHHIFRAFLAGEAQRRKKARQEESLNENVDDDAETNKELPAPEVTLSKKAFMDCASLYVLRWHRWLHDWLKGREDIGNAVHEFALAAPEALEAMKQLPHTGDDSHDEMSVWTIHIDRSNGDRLGLAIDRRGRIQKTEDVGLIASWNAQAAPMKVVRVGDFVLSVNGNSNSEMASMFAALGQPTMLDVTIGREYPLRRSVMSHWVIEIDRSHGAATGMDVRTKRSDVLVIRSVASGGLLAAWNEAHPWRAVRAGDWFAEANGKSSAYEIADEINQQKLLNTGVCRSEINHWSVQIDTSERGNLGMTVHLMYKECCECSQVGLRGLIPRWNAEHPNQALAAGDLILEVNGKSNPTEILAELTKGKRLEIVALRPAQPWMIRLDMPVGAAAARAGPARLAGIKLRKKHNDDIEVKSLDPGSQITVWNASNSDKAIHPQDQILSVNGLKDWEKISDELKQAEVLKILVMRKATPWVVVVDGSEGGLGVQANIRRTSEIEVKSIVLGGTLSAWNFLHASRAIRPGDRVKSVNEKTGPEAIAAELKKKQLLNIEVERDELLHWTVVLDRTTNLDVGAILHVRRHASLEVASITKEGLIPQQNKRHAARAIRVGDRILEVNEAVSLEHMKQQLSKLHVLELTICREELAPASMSEATAQMAVLPDMNEELEENEAQSLFQHFDRGSKGWWSDADLHYVCRLIWQRQRLPPPPRSFAIEVLKRIREEAKRANSLLKGQPEHATRLISEEITHGFGRFAKKHHDVLRRWTSTRCQNQYKCPNCGGRFRVRIDTSGQEVPQVAGGPTQMRSSAPPFTASVLFPLPAGIAALHEGVIRGVRKGSMTFALPPGSARPALSGRLLLEVCASGLMRGSVGILAPTRELEATAAWLAATAPELPREFLRADYPQVQLVPEGTWFGKKGGTIFFSTGDVFHAMVLSDRVSIDEIDFVICACGPAEIPLVSELQEEAPLSLLGGSLPKVVCLLDASSSTHKALLEHFEKVAAVRQHLEAASTHLEQIPAGAEVREAANTVDKMLLVAGRYPPTQPPEQVESKDAGLALAALSGRIDVRLLPHQKVLPQYATEEGREVARQRKTLRHAPQSPAKAAPGAGAGAGGVQLGGVRQTGAVMQGGAAQQPQGGVQVGRAQHLQAGAQMGATRQSPGGLAAVPKSAATNFM